ncbi:DUF805 domain-containing protein [Caulobacter hibisci]|uniref:DUF805 domain-containing protein n=1 Tax=Caulobacter hibisci TaxID=2035993 RepID=A0ABS0T1S0_9CAUL|nr:DUF805 domain-containing protein [Caulobacter hibisci]MBI1685833.1 DUF805 domain-containing protein [Caulobacter hibisci]
MSALALRKVLRTALLGRGGRPEYWFGLVATICVFGVAFAYWPGGRQLFPPWMAILIWLWVASRRLRDIGWPAWLCLWPIIVAVAALLTVPQVGRLWLYQLLNLLPLPWLLFAIAIGAWKPKAAALASPEDQAGVFG